MRLDEFRVSVQPGHGLVARFPTSLLIVTAPDWAGLPAVDRLLEECRQGRAGRPLFDRLFNLVDAEPDKVPAFCTLADDDDGLTFFVHGDTQVVITGAQPVMRMSGRSTAGWTGGVGDQVASLVVGPAQGNIDLAASTDRSDLRDGVVPGGAIVLFPRGQLAMAAPVLAQVAAPPAPFEPAAPPAQAAAAPPPFEPAAPPAQATAPAVEAAPPSFIPVEPSARSPILPATVPPAAVDGPPTMVWGVHCKRGHFNNPDARYCRMCGTHMVHQRRDPVLGPRPVLGYLIVDDGCTFKLDADYVIGRQPGVEPSVQAGEARGLTLSDPEDSVSPAHAAVRLDQWNVFLTDLMPRYGTHVWRPGTAGWVRLDPGQKVMLEPRTHLLFGRRTVVFDSMTMR